MVAGYWWLAALPAWLFFIAQLGRPTNIVVLRKSFPSKWFAGIAVGALLALVATHLTPNQIVGVSIASATVVWGIWRRDYLRDLALSKEPSIQEELERALDNKLPTPHEKVITELLALARETETYANNKGDILGSWWVNLTPPIASRTPEELAAAHTAFEEAKQEITATFEATIHPRIQAVYRKMRVMGLPDEEYEALFATTPNELVGITATAMLLERTAARFSKAHAEQQQRE